MNKQDISSALIRTSQLISGDERGLHTQRGLRSAPWLLMMGILVMVGGIAGCAQTEQAKTVETSGFLGDYSILQPGKEGEALLVYRNPQADFSIYRAVYVEPAIVLMTQKSSVPQEELNRLAGDLPAISHLET